MGCVGGTGRDHERTGVRYRLTAPFDVARLSREQPQDSPKERCLAGADLPGDHHELPQSDVEVDSGYADTGTWVRIGEPSNAQDDRVTGFASCRRGGDLQLRFERDRIGEIFPICATHEVDGATDGDLGLSNPRQEYSDEPGRLGHELQHEHEQGELADRETGPGIGAQGAHRQNEDQPGPHADRVVEDRFDPSCERAIPDHVGTAAIVESIEVAQHRRFGIGDLDGLNRPEHLSEEPGYVLGRLPGRRSIAPDSHSEP